MRVISGPISFFHSYVYHSCIFQLQCVGERIPSNTNQAWWDCGQQNISRARVNVWGNILPGDNDARPSHRLWCARGLKGFDLCSLRWQMCWFAGKTSSVTGSQSFLSDRLKDIYSCVSGGFGPCSEKFWSLSSIINTRLLEDSFSHLVFAALFLILSFF